MDAKPAGAERPETAGSAAPPSRYPELLEKNRRYLWNPFIQMQAYLASRPLIVERGEGVRLVDVDGRAYYDGNSSLWLNVHGHRTPELDRAVAEQLGRIAHSTLLGQASVPALELAERLVEAASPGLSKVFYSDSGSEAVEIALKLAVGYWRRRGQPERRAILSMRNAYHGDTVGAVSVGGIDLFHAEFEPLLFPTRKVPYPYPYRFEGPAQECAAACLAEFEAELERHGAETAALVLEPIVQAAAGLIVMPEGFLAATAELCRRPGDRVQFHRVGEEELLALWEDVRADRYVYRIEEEPFDVGAYLDWAAGVQEEANERRRRGEQAAARTPVP